MDRRTTVLSTLHQYKELRDNFIGLCTALEALPTENDFEEVKVSPGDGVSRNVSVLGHHCKLVFSIHIEENKIFGKLTFQRLFPQERTSDFLTVYFDRLGNAIETPKEGRSLPYSISSTEGTDWLLISILEAFFKDLAAPIGAQA